VEICTEEFSRCAWQPVETLNPRFPTPVIPAQAGIQSVSLREASKILDPADRIYVLDSGLRRNDGVGFEA
jgi:hypothetical protein